MAEECDGLLMSETVTAGLVMDVSGLWVSLERRFCGVASTLRGGPGNLVEAFRAMR